jgi:hypothetical protein
MIGVIILVWFGAACVWMALHARRCGPARDIVRIRSTPLYASDPALPHHDCEADWTILDDLQLDRLLRDSSG